MGSSASKAAKTAATGAARRQFPTRVPPPPISDSPASASVPPETPAVGPTVHPTPQASETKGECKSLSLCEAVPGTQAKLFISDLARRPRPRLRRLPPHSRPRPTQVHPLQYLHLHLNLPLDAGYPTANERPFPSTGSEHLPQSSAEPCPPHPGSTGSIGNRSGRGVHARPEEGKGPALP